MVLRLLLFGCAALAGCYHVPRATVQRGGAVAQRVPVRSGEPLVRIRLSTGDKVTLSAGQVLTLAGGSARQEVAAGQNVEVAADNGVVVRQGGRLLQRFKDTVDCRTAENGRVEVAGRKYRGSLRIFVSGERELVVLNVLPLEEYLYGVVPCEIGPAGPATVEAVKAQAVAARSFTFARMAKQRYSGFDLWDSYRRDQEYQGTRRETDETRRAIDATRGEVMQFQGQAAEALYHANCGGVTSEGFQPFLKSVYDTPGHRRGARAFCAGRPNSSWQVVVSRESLESAVARILGMKGRPSVRSFRLDKDKQSGRVRYLHFTTARGEVRVHGADFRSGLGLKSQNLSMSLRSSRYVIDGRGYGHGSGMCQDGALGMARSGSGYRDILHHYYTGVRLVRVY